MRLGENELDAGLRRIGLGCLGILQEFTPCRHAVALGDNRCNFQLCIHKILTPLDLPVPIDCLKRLLPRFGNRAEIKQNGARITGLQRNDALELRIRIGVVLNLLREQANRIRNFDIVRSGFHRSAKFFACL